MTGIDPDRFRKHAEECHEQAAKNPVDKQAWLRLADDLIKIAEGLELLPAAKSNCGTVDTVGARIDDTTR